MALFLIPRTKVNYTFFDLLRAMFIRNSSTYVKKAELKLSELYDNRYVRLVNSGRSALYLILKSLPQSKVVIPAYTCPVVVEAAMAAGKTIRYVGIDKKTFISNSFGKIDSETIVLATYQYGYPCNISEIAKACNDVGAVLIEDAAASINTMIDGKRAGTWGDYAIISFNHSKQITVPCGGGIIISKVDINSVINRDEIVTVTPIENRLHKRYAIISLLITNKYFYKTYYKKFIANNDDLSSETCAKLNSNTIKEKLCNMSNWRAFLLYKQIERLNKYTKRRKNIFDYYTKHITNPIVTKPLYVEGADYSRYVIRVNTDIRRYFCIELINNGIDVDFSHHKIASPLSFEYEHKLASEIINIPFYYKLSKRNVKYVVDKINQINL